MRYQLRLTQKEMCVKLGVKQSYYSEVENAKRKVTSKIVERLHTLFQINSNWFYSGDGEMFLETSLVTTTKNTDLKVNLADAKYIIIKINRLATQFEIIINTEI